MLAIPAIDLIDGQVVRLFQGDFNRKTGYTLDPVVYANAIREAGLERLHLVDLDGAKQGKLVHTDLLREMAKTGLRIDFGGGVKTEADIRQILDTQADQVVVGSLCVKDPETVWSWITVYGVDRFILALDTDGESVKINGWQDGSGMTLDQVLQPFLEFNQLAILTTDIRRDGTGNGPSVTLYEQLVQQYPQFHWIASGGVESLNDLRELRAVGCSGCVVGKALLDGKITLNELKQFNDEYNL